ncbi:MAG TPA: hypothetical protein VM509_06045 [Planctomycetota bacterium]|nr:hypothetical protein [Planctomycetota bacterium]
MSLLRGFVSLVLAAAAVLSACGSSDPAPAPASSTDASADESDKALSQAAKEAELDFSNAPAHIAKLIPANTAVYLQLQSLKTVDLLLGRLARSNDDFGRRIDDIRRTLHRMIPGDERHVLQEQRVGIAVTFPQDGEPEFTFVLPLRDPVAYKRSLQISAHMPQPVFDGSYLAVTNSPTYERPREPVALALGLADKPISARVDLTRLDRRYGSQIRLALAAVAREGGDEKLAQLVDDPQLTAWIQEASDPLLYALAVGRQMDFALQIIGDRMRLESAVETRDAGVLAGWTASEPVDLTPFARSLVASDTIALLGGCDPSVLAERLAPLITDSDAEREHVARLLESFADQFGSIGAVTGSLASGESHFAVHVLATEDAAFSRKLASTLELFSRSGLGVAVQAKNVATMEEVEVEDLLVRFDAASMCLLTGERTSDLPAVQERLDEVARTVFGAETVRVRIATFGGRGLIAISNDEVWFRRTLLWAKENKDLTPPDVRGALEHLGSARAGVVVRVDVARWKQDRDYWASQWRALSEPVPDHGLFVQTTVHALDPHSLTMHLGAEGRTLRIGLSMGLPPEPSEDMARR